MSPRPSSQHLQQEHEQQERTLTLALLAQAMRDHGANEPTIRRAITGIHTYLTLTGTTTLSQPDQPLALPLATPDTSPTTSATCLADMPTEAGDWLWQDHIPTGAITLLDGDPDSTLLLALQLAACLSSAHPFPDGSPSQPGNVLFLAPHEHPQQSILPLLQTAGADLNHLFLLSSIPHLDPHTIQLRHRPFSLTRDLDLLEDTISQLHIHLLILHTLETPRPSTRTALAQLAQRTHCAILLLRPFGHSAHTSSRDLLSTLASSHLHLDKDPADHEQQQLRTRQRFRPQPSTLVALVQHEHAIPTLVWLGEKDDSRSDSQTLSTLLGSIQRNRILFVLQESDTPMDARSIAERLVNSYESTRKTLQRMLHAGQLVSPARGLFTTPDHPCLTQSTDHEHLEGGETPAETPFTPLISAEPGISLPLTPSPVPCPNVPTIGPDPLATQTCIANIPANTPVPVPTIPTFPTQHQEPTAEDLYPSVMIRPRKYYYDYD